MLGDRLAASVGDSLELLVPVLRDYIVVGVQDGIFLTLEVIFFKLLTFNH